jgi:cell division protein FtsA
MVKTKPLPVRSKGSLVAALDIGTAKICCLIAKISDQGDLQVVGIGHHESRGLKSGRIIDMDAAARCVGQAVQTAENMTGELIHQVVINLSATQTGSHLLQGGVALPHEEVTDSDIRRTLAYARDVEIPGQNKLIHTIPVSFDVDAQFEIKDPKGMHGRRLTSRLHAVTASSQAVKNLQNVVQMNHLNIESFCVDSYASALSCLVPDEMDLGCTVIDFGAGTTSISLIQDGKLVYADAIPVGGWHITQDIARGLTTPLHHAERMKTLYGHAIRAARDENDMIEVPQIGEEDLPGGHYMPRSYLTGIIQPRVEEILELVRAKLDASMHGASNGRRVVITGGASQLNGLRDLAGLILDKQIRVASPRKMLGLAEVTAGPAFSTACGLLHYAVNHMDERPDVILPNMKPGTLVSRVRHWLQENW